MLTFLCIGSIRTQDNGIYQNVWWWPLTRCTIIWIEDECGRSTFPQETYFLDFFLIFLYLFNKIFHIFFNTFRQIFHFKICWKNENYLYLYGKRARNCVWLSFDTYWYWYAEHITTTNDVDEKTWTSIRRQIQQQQSLNSITLIFMEKSYLTHKNDVKRRIYLMLIFENERASKTVAISYKQRRLGKRIFFPSAKWEENLWKISVKIQNMKNDKLVSMCTWLRAGVSVCYLQSFFLFI